MASSRTLLKITLVIAALLVTTTVIITSPIEAKSQSVQWSWNGGSAVEVNYPALSPNGDLFTYSVSSSHATIYVVSPEGKSLWNDSLALANIPQFGPDGTIFVPISISNTRVNGSGLLVLDQDGNMKWTFTVPGISEGMLVLPDGGVVLGAMAVFPGQHSLTCLNADGTVRWTKGDYETNLTNPMMYPVGIRGNDILVSSTSYTSPARSTITEYSPDGTALFTFGTDFAPQSIFFASDGTMRMVGFNYSRTTDYEYLYGLSANGSFQWAKPLSNEYGDLVLLPDGTTIYSQLTGTTSLILDIYAVDGNGNSLWTSVGAKSVPVAFGSGILFSNSTAMMLIDRDGNLLWNLSGSYYGQPATDGRTIYAGNAGNLVAISETPWKMTWQPAVLVLTVIIAMIGVAMLGGRTPRLE